SASSDCAGATVCRSETRFRGSVLDPDERTESGLFHPHDGSRGLSRLSPQQARGHPIDLSAPEINALACPKPLADSGIAVAGRGDDGAGETTATQARRNAGHRLDVAGFLTFPW